MVVWNKDEESKVVWNALYLCEHNKNLTVLQAIRQAQKNMLPKERHRVVRCSAKMKSIIHKINGVMKKEHILAPEIKKPELNTEQIVEEFFFRVSQPLVASITEAVLANVNNRLYDVTQSALSTIMDKIKTGQNVQNHSKSKEESRKLNIVIIGLLPVQKNDIEEYCEDKYNLKFFDAEDKHSQIQHAALCADKIIIDGKFVSHTITNLFKGDKRCQVFHGGVSALKRII